VKKVFVRVLTALFVVFLLISLTACGDGNASESIGAIIDTSAESDIDSEWQRRYEALREEYERLQTEDVGLNIDVDTRPAIQQERDIFLAIFINAIIVFCDYCPLSGILRSIKIPQGVIKMVMPLPKRTEHDLHPCTILEAASNNHTQTHRAYRWVLPCSEKNLRQQGINSCGNGREREGVNLFNMSGTKPSKGMTSYEGVIFHKYSHSKTLHCSLFGI